MFEGEKVREGGEREREWEEGGKDNYSGFIKRLAAKSYLKLFTASLMIKHSGYCTVTRLCGIVYIFVCTSVS